MGDTDGNNTLTYVLPDIVDPADTICVTIRIPNNKWHIMAFKGAMFDLACWWNWERDDAHTATLVARVWRKIFYALKFGCDTPEIQTYGDYEEMPRFKDKCDHDLFYIGCDDTEHKIAFVGDIPASSVTTGNESQPSPGGGVQEYCKSFPASGVSLIPALLNSGDVITMENAIGSGYDGAGTVWYCPTGDQLFVTCQAGSGHLNGGDPIPTSNHMSLIVKIGSSFYPIAVGSPLTVPGGVANAQAWIQVNDATLSDNQGSYQICYTVTNNIAATWVADLDLTISNHGFVAEDFAPYSVPTATTWVSGQGFQSIGGGGSNYLIGLFRMDLSGAGNITQTTVYYHVADNLGLNTFAEETIGGTVVAPTTTYAGNFVTGDGTTQNSVVVQSIPLQSIRVRWRNGPIVPGTPGTMFCTRVVIQGNGHNPFV